MTNAHVYSKAHHVSVGKIKKSAGKNSGLWAECSFCLFSDTKITNKQLLGTARKKVTTGLVCRVTLQTQHKERTAVVETLRVFSSTNKMLTAVSDLLLGGRTSRI